MVYYDSLTAVDIKGVPMLRLFIFSLLLTASFASHAYKPVEGAYGAEWWNIPYPTAFNSAKLKPQSHIGVRGNKFVDSKGDVIIFRGVNISDPDKLVKQKQWKKSLFTELKDWGTNIVRIPIHPIAYRERGRDGYFELLDQAVTWANELDMYLILDWHSMGYLETEVFFHPMYETTKSETLTFWKDMSKRYNDVPTFAVYEIFNEPTTWGGALGKLDWTAWRLFNEQAIDIIRATDKKVIPMVAGFNWAYDLSHVKKEPIERKGIAYAIHPYPQKEKNTDGSQAGFHKAWQSAWGHLSSKYPMIASELGWVAEGGYGAHVPVIDDGTYGPNIESFMEKRGISWTVWCFDPNWAPTMISDWSFTPTEQGKFFKKIMQSKNGKTQ